MIASRYSLGGVTIALRTIFASESVTIPELFLVTDCDDRHRHGILVVTVHVDDGGMVEIVADAIDDDEAERTDERYDDDHPRYAVKHDIRHKSSRALHVTRHAKHVTRHTSHVTRHTSHVTRHTSHVTRHTSP